MRLLVGRFLDFDFGGGLADFPLEFLTGLLEFSQTLTETARQFGEFFRSEEQNKNQGDENRFRPAGHAKSNRESHSDETT